MNGCFLCIQPYQNTVRNYGFFHDGGQLLRDLGKGGSLCCRYICFNAVVVVTVVMPAYTTQSCQTSDNVVLFTCTMCVNNRSTRHVNSLYTRKVVIVLLIAMELNTAGLEVMVVALSRNGSNDRQ